jgi:hypothetical protein
VPAAVAPEPEGQQQPRPHLAKLLLALGPGCLCC